MSEMADSVTVPQLTLGWRLQMSLGQSPHTRAAIAAALGVDASTVGRWMNDRGAPPKRAYVTQWAWLTGVPVEWLDKGVTPEGFDRPTRDSQGGANDGNEGNNGRYSRSTSCTAEMQGRAGLHRKSTVTGLPVAA